MSEEEKVSNEELLAVEDDILQGLINAAEDQEQDTVKIEIARKGKVYFSFYIRGLSEKEYNHCRTKATNFSRNRNLGVKVADETNVAKLRSLLIYNATLEEDRKKLWENKQVWEKLNVVNSHDLIDKVLKPGEKDMIVEKIDELSGYDDESDLEETVKNS